MEAGRHRGHRVAERLTTVSWLARTNPARRHRRYPRHRPAVWTAHQAAVGGQRGDGRAGDRMSARVAPDQRAVIVLPSGVPCGRRVAVVGSPEAAERCRTAADPRFPRRRLLGVRSRLRSLITVVGHEARGEATPRTVRMRGRGGYFAESVATALHSRGATAPVHSPLPVTILGVPDQRRLGVRVMRR